MEEKEVKISRKERIFQILFIVALFIFTLWLNYDPWKSLYNDYLLEKNGMETIAKVLDKDYSLGGRGVALYKLTLTYTPSESIIKEKMTKEFYVSSTAYTLAPLGGQIPILYLLDQPEIIKVKDAKPKLRGLLGCILFDILLLIAIFHSILVYFRDKRKHSQVME